MRSQRTANAAIGIAVVAWGSMNVVVKALPESSITLAFHRAWLLGLLTGSYLFARRRFLGWSKLKVGIPSGLAFTANSLCLLTAIQTTTMANATVILALQPVVMMGIAGRRYGERLGVLSRTLVFCAVGGVAMTVMGSSGKTGWSLLGDVAAVASLATWVWYFLATRRARSRLTAVEQQFAVGFVGTILLGPLLVLTSGSVMFQHPSSMLGVASLVLFASGGHLMLSWALAYTTLTIASVLTLAVPLVSTVGAAAFLSEDVSQGQLVGMMISLVCLALLLGRSTSIAGEA